MDIDHGRLESLIYRAENIFDIYIYIYDILRKNISDLYKGLETEYDRDSLWKNQLIDLHDNKDFNMDINEEYKMEILNIIHQCDGYNILVFLKALFQEIDEIAGDKYYLTSKIHIHEDDGENIQLKHLNSNVTLDMGQVFYQHGNFLNKIIGNDERFTLEKETGETIARYQKNLLVKKDSGSDIKTNIFRINDRYITKKVKGKKDNFKVALIPFSNDRKILNTHTFDRPDGKHIAIKGINQEDKYINLVKDILEKIAELEIDIVIFPEMVFTRNMISEVKEVLRNNRGKFILVICGTIWENRSNICISLGGNGIEVGNQKKLNRYRTDKGYIEDIDLDSNEKLINIYDLEGLGRFSTPICIDFIEPDYFKNIVDMGVNICLVPTYTPSLEGFRENAKALGKKNFGGVFLSNYCGKAKSDDISFAYIPRKGKSMYPIACEHERCDNGLCYKNFIIDILEKDL